jgi:DNA-binding MarR family transcriptional regulator
LGIGESAASSLVEQLVRAGYARRTEDPADRRRAVVTVTERGASLLGELRHGKRVALREWLEKLSEDDRAMLGRALSALAAVLPQTEAQAGSGADDARVQP